MLKTPSPSAKKPKFDLSELDEKQKPVIPEPESIVTTVPEKEKVAEKVEKPAKISRKKRNFAAMLGGSTATGATPFDGNAAMTQDGMGPF